MITNDERLAKEKQGCCWNALWENQAGPGSHAETGRVSGCPRGEGKESLRTERTPPTRAKRKKAWHFQGSLRSERGGGGQQEPDQAVRTYIMFIL